MSQTTTPNEALSQAHAAEARPMDADSWAELYRLREEVKGPDGHASWKAAAIAERALRVGEAPAWKGERAHLDALEDGTSPGWLEDPNGQWPAFKAWASDHLGQGYSLAVCEGSIADPVTSWCFRGFRAAKESLASALAVNVGGEAPADGLYWAFWEKSTEWKAMTFHAGYAFAHTTRWAGPILPPAPDAAAPRPQQPDAPVELDVHFWLRSALNCKEFAWDDDQRAMAQAALDADVAPEREAAPAPVKLTFPGVLRKMWSAGEIQDWLDRLGPLYAAPPFGIASVDRRHVGTSKFESWYADHPKACGGDKQLARDSYAAGMGDDTPQPRLV